jgi:hypothetical protein
MVHGFLNTDREYASNWNVYFVLTMSDVAISANQRIPVYSRSIISAACNRRSYTISLRITLLWGVRQSYEQIIHNKNKTGYRPQLQFVVQSIILKDFASKTRPVVPGY